MIPTAVLDRRTRSQRSISLKTLKELTTATGFGDLREAVGALSAHTAAGDDRKGHRPAQTAAPKTKAAAESPKSAARKSSASRPAPIGPIGYRLKYGDHLTDDEMGQVLRDYVGTLPAELQAEAKAHNLHTAAGQKDLLDLIGWATTIKSARSKVRAALAALASLQGLSATGHPRRAPPPHSRDVQLWQGHRVTSRQGSGPRR